MIRKLLLLTLLSGFALLTASSGCGQASESAKGNVTVKGKLSNCKADSVVLKDANSQQLTVMSKAPIDDSGNYTLSFDVLEKGFYRIETDDQNFVILVAGPGDVITLDGNASNLGYSYTVSGSEESALFKEINDYGMELGMKKNRIGQQKDSIIRNYQFLLSKRPNDKKYADSLDKAVEPVFTGLDEQLTPLIQDGVNRAKDFIDKHPGSFANLVAIGMLNQEADFPYFQKVHDEFKKRYPESKSLGGFYAWMKEKMKLAPGTPAPDFTVTAPDGKPLALSSFKGKVVLVDFWASWCGPCRKENPNVVRLYSKYKNKGLEIFGVSLDDSRDKWLDAIAKDGLTWMHGSELMGWNSSFCQLYNITSIPYTVLVDRDGNIISTNLRGPSLEKKLEQIFGS